MMINGVFEGGGIRGLAYIGALRFLEERGFRFHSLGGSSIGAVIASLVAVGYNSFQLEELVNDFDLNILKGTGNMKKISKIIQTVKQKGLYSIDNFEKYLNSLYRNQGMTDFRSLKMGEDYLFKAVATDLGSKRKVILPDDLIEYGYLPESFPLAKAVAISACIPFVFAPYRLGDSILADGGLTDNFPIGLFSKSSIPTLGFRLTDFSDYRENFFDTCKKRIFPSDSSTELLDSVNIIDIDTLGIKATEFEKGIRYRAQLYLSGYQSMRRFFYQNYHT